MKNLKNLEFQELSLDESQDINGGLIATVYSTLALCILLYRAASTPADSFS